MTEQQIDTALDNATRAVISEFEKLGAELPEGQELSDLMYRINDALTALMCDVIPTTD